MLGPGEALVELVGVGLYHSDLSKIKGTIPRTLPMILGHEASGIVHEVGAQESLIPSEKTIPLDKATLFGCAVLTGVRLSPRRERDRQT